ncbi:type II secretion system F family protein [Sansalvadorimonas sp. 2012CJ34-2]|uniref:Type II secretion system F family protein n=1 Tax=Parendozoicomonas callyspongiae TaxID=2942213 RepID=A0ABT0PB70_9GAMM|nr:type II secretion system F family protein [Sansalvadorimonas sp. 2012CJ34-2]MCL6268523.1 type II secretion system F family protein [Sansalvadorimonas sp. 2012CJ34-2]
MIYLVMIGLALVLVFVALGMEKKENSFAFLEGTGSHDADEDADLKAVNIKMLTDEPFKVRIRVGIENLKARIGGHAVFKGVLFLGVVVVASIYLQKYLLSDMYILVLLPLVFLITSLLFIRILQIYDRKVFEVSFPNALNLLNGAVSSGESLMHSIIYVGNSMEGAVGREFKLMGQRLRLGQPAEKVLSQSCHRFPYAPFYFFTITLRANINRGGQLKEIIKRLNQVMFNSRAIEKKKGAMTAEARMSVKIVAAIPFFFMGFMYLMSPENFHFVFYDPAGKIILYYVLASEVIGITIIWLLMRKTQT